MRRFRPNEYGVFDRCETVLLAEKKPWFRARIHLAQFNLEWNDDGTWRQPDYLWRFGTNFERHNGGGGGLPGIGRLRDTFKVKRAAFATREAAMDAAIDEAIEYFSHNGNSCQNPTPKKFIAELEAARPTQAAFDFGITTTA